MRYMLLLTIFIFSSVIAKEWKTEFFSISIPSKFHIEDKDEQNSFAAFVPDEKFGHPKEMLVIKIGKGNEFTSFIVQGNEALSEIGGELQQEPCNPKCTLYTSEIKLENNETSRSHFMRIIKTEKYIYAITYFCLEPIQDGRKFVDKIMQQINGNGI